MGGFAAKLASKVLTKDFKQQKMRSFRPLCAPIPIIVFLFAFCLVFVPVGVALVYASSRVHEHMHIYAARDKEPCGDVCTFTMEIDEKMETPVYVYYRLTNYYQNHRKYMNSRSTTQLKGTVLKTWSDLADCDPVKSVDDNHDPQYFYVPCGLGAFSFFTDSIQIFNALGDELKLHKNGIAYDSDKNIFKNPSEKPPGVIVVDDVEDEDFIVWMRAAPFSNFKKLWRIVKDGDRGHSYLKGNYTIVVQNRYPVTMFDGSKAVVLSTTTIIGGKNPVLGWVYIGVGAASGGCGFIVLLERLFFYRKYGEARVSWSCSKRKKVDEPEDEQTPVADAQQAYATPADKFGGSSSNAQTSAQAQQQ